MNTTTADLIASLRHDPARQAKVAADLGKKLKPVIPPGAKPDDPYRSKTERAYAAQLARRQARKEIRGWVYEPFKILLAEKTTYLIDFLVAYPDGLIECVEVKGYEREDDRLRINFAAQLLPIFRFRMVKRVRGIFKTTRLLNDFAPRAAQAGGQGNA